MKLVLGVSLTLAFALVGAVDAERKARHKSESATEDFEFEEEIQAHRRQTKLPRNQDHFEATTNARPHKLLKVTQDSELCLALRCSKEEHCLVKNENVALCVPNKKPARDRKLGALLPTASTHIDIDGEDEEDDLDEDDDDDEDDEDDDEDDSDDISEYENESLERRPSLPRCPTCPVAKPTFVCGSDNKTYSSPCRIHYHNCVHQAAIKMMCKGFCPCQIKHEQKQKQVHQRWNNFINKYKMTVDQKQNGGSPKIIGVNTVTSSNDKNQKFNTEENKKKNMADKFVSKTDAKSTMSNHNPPYAEDKQRQKGHNSVLSEKMDKVKANVADKSDCTPHQLKVMQNRLLDWFALLVAEAKKQKKMHLQGSSQTIDHCQPQVEWIFTHLDIDEDGKLSLHELDDLERDAHEHCMKPFLEHCDSNRDADLTPSEWCACFDSKERPCLTAKSRSKTGFMDSYVPSCDEHGFYQPTQCSHATVELCWCVDKHGVEYANTRMKGKPDCDSIVGKNSSDDSEDEDSSDDESLMEGSADQPLDI